MQIKRSVSSNWHQRVKAFIFFCRHLYSSVIPEDAGPGSEVVTVTAHDADEGFNGRQVYYLTGDNANMFVIDSGLVNNSTLFSLLLVKKY